jgi:hypothetical protein
VSQVSDDEAEQIIDNAGTAAVTTEGSFVTEVASGSTVRHGHNHVYCLLSQQQIQ